MAYPQLRSMNASLFEGATDGRYKKIRMDAECSTATDAKENLTYNLRDDLGLAYYGIGEKRTLTVPAGPKDYTMPDYYDNKLQNKVDQGILGQTW